MRTDHESNQSVEVIYSGYCHELGATIGLKCTATYFPGSFDPRYGGEPPSGPEFELTTITVAVPRVNRKAGENEFEAPLNLTWSQLLALVGEDIAEQLFEDATQEAAESGEF